MTRKNGLSALLVALAAAALAWAAPAAASVDLPPGEVAIPTSGTFLYMNSRPGDYIGASVEHLYTSADSAIGGSLSAGGNFFSASVNQANFTHWWFVDLQAPSGQELAAGSYENAQRWPFQPPDVPGLSVSGDGRGCNTLTGQFDVNALDYAPTGELLVFEADFEQHCEGNPAALFGRIRIENPPPPPDETAPTLHLPGDLTVEAPDGNGANVWYSAWATDDRDPAPRLECNPDSGSLFPVGTTTVECTATDRAGNTGTGSFAVSVLPPLAFGLSLHPAGAVNTRTGVATISGRIECSRPLETSVSGTVTQLFARRVTITGSFSLQVSCTAPSTEWSASVSGTNGRFGAGSAHTDANVFGCELSCHSASTAGDVRLRGNS
jgi:hypothetical protein